MLKFYRLEARRILAGPKKMSTIVITTPGTAAFRNPVKRIDSPADVEMPLQTGVRGRRDCGKAEDESG